MALKRVVVLAGGISHERDVSLRSGRQVADSLLEHGLTVEVRPVADICPTFQRAGANLSVAAEA